jgi:hypothetical protein
MSWITIKIKTVTRSLHQIIPQKLNQVREETEISSKVVHRHLQEKGQTELMTSSENTVQIRKLPVAAFMGYLISTNS